MPFTRKISHSALYKLEQYDETLADICQSSQHDAASSAHSIDDTYNPASIDNSFSSTTICSYDHHDLKQLECLGSGAYCRVSKVRASNNTSEEVMAKKTIDPARLSCRQDLNVAAEELANEAKMLSGLDHENIIKLRGVSSERFSESFVSGKGGYFLVMDMLSETLHDRLDRERNECKHKAFDKTSAQKKAFAFFRKSNTPTKPQVSVQKQLHNRIEETALGIARGMKYLHSKDIVLRDLKPDNIGFENSTYDIVKLFDFGMASKVQDCDPNETCGSPRYMAPEVMTGDGYTFAVDVYSFGVILYELCSLKKPYDVTFDKIQRKLNRRKRHRRSKSRNESILEFYQTVVDHELRPYDNLEDEICCPKLRSLIEACCKHDPTQRPSFEHIHGRLVEIFYPELFAPDHEDEEENEARESTGKRSSVSIEFDSDCEILTTNNDPQQR